MFPNGNFRLVANLPLLMVVTLTVECFWPFLNGEIIANDCLPEEQSPKSSPTDHCSWGRPDIFSAPNQLKRYIGPAADSPRFISIVCTLGGHLEGGILGRQRLNTPQFPVIKHPLTPCFHLLVTLIWSLLHNRSQFNTIHAIATKLIGTLHQTLKIVYRPGAAGAAGCSTNTFVIN